MPNFYDIHQKAIDRAFNVNRLRPGECFRIVMWEPLEPSTARATVENDTATIITFRLLTDRSIEPANIGDREAIVDFNERHKHTSPNAWMLPDFGRTLK